MTAPTSTGYALVNGINLFYATWGSGAPLVLLHGGLGSVDMFGEVLPALASNRQVIGVDLQAHGRTADVDRPMRFETMADDIAALIHDHMHLDQADVAGYSLGGGVALRTAIQHPEIVRKLVLVSTPFRRDGWHAENLAGMSQMGAQSAEFMKQTPMYQEYARVAPRPEDWPILHQKLGDLLRVDYDWSSEVSGITAQTLLVIGDNDSVRPSHAVAFYELLGGGIRDAGWDGSGMSSARLAVLPGLTHYNIFSSPAIVPTIDAFLR